MTTRKILLLALPAFLFCGEAAAKPKLERPLTSSVQVKQTETKNSVGGKIGKRAAPTKAGMPYCKPGKRCW
jgi:hypothetical protein